jgi:hypothetical protein
MCGWSGPRHSAVRGRGVSPASNSPSSCWCHPKASVYSSPSRPDNAQDIWPEGRGAIQPDFHGGGALPRLFLRPAVHTRKGARWSRRAWPHRLYTPESGLSCGIRWPHRGLRDEPLCHARDLFMGRMELSAWAHMQATENSMHWGDGWMTRWVHMSTLSGAGE